MIEFTDWAVQILRRSHEAARRFNPDATVRVFRKGAGVEFALVDGPVAGDQVVERDDFTLEHRHRVAAVVIGATTGFVIGITSAGSGTVIAILLITLFRLSPRRGPRPGCWASRRARGAWASRRSP